MDNMPPQCRKKLQAAQLGPYPRSACLKCGWRVTAGSIDDMCTEPGYAKEQAVEATALDQAGAHQDYKQKMQMWIDAMAYHTGLDANNGEQRPLLFLYTMLAMTVGEEVTQEHIHDAWAVWTLIIREQSSHPNMVPFNMLSDRTKALDKIDMWAIHSVAKELKA